MSEKYEEYYMAKDEEATKKATADNIKIERERNKKEAMLHRLKYKAHYFKDQLEGVFGSGHELEANLDRMESAEKFLDEALYSIFPTSRPDTKNEDK